MKSASRLRYSSIEAMPEPMRMAARLAAVPATVEKGDKVRKYRNKPTTIDGIRFDSKSEASYYEMLQLLRESGRVKWFTRQVPFWLEGGVKFIIDFLVVYADGSVVLEDVKSKATITQAYLNKKKQLKARYGLTVIEVAK